MINKNNVFEPFYETKIMRALLEFESAQQLYIFKNQKDANFFIKNNIKNKENKDGK
jgi:hypothetical protein